MAVLKTKGKKYMKSLRMTNFSISLYFITCYEIWT